jgi:hypothetical protein
MKKKLKYIIFLALSVFLITCGGNEKKIPEGIIPREKMVEIITEIELTQALIKVEFSNQDTLNQKHLFNQIYSSFKVSEEQFNTSLSFYCNNPKILEEIYVQTIIKLSKNQAKEF